MQDKLKYRFWHKPTKKMMDCYGYNPEYVFGDTLDGVGTEYNPAKFSDCVLMQCTGLKDKNGKLIYGGDIVTIPNLYPFYDYKDLETPHKSLNETFGKIEGESILNYIGIVEWIFSSWQYRYHCVNPLKNGISEGINNELNENGYDDGENSEYLIIGNIYENPELLEGKNE